ncbi:MAG: transglycosylase SLT domain-containing protein [Bacteroidales bacterium]|nr:transglycosylase SLT domain-containing protein [Bacteroidales bacterium]
MRTAFRIILVLLGLMTVPFTANREPLSEQPVEEFIEPGPISVYDEMIRSASDAAGVDWRLVAAIIYHESRFHISASSDRGATGLMQVRSARYEPDSLLDPATNLQVGTRYLRRMQKMFSPMAADTLECLKFALAAYNAGEGKMLRNIENAEARGLDGSRWDEIIKLSPGGPSNATKAYVEGVLDKYREYALLFPSTSSK